MANRKISEFTALTAPASGDTFAILDVDASGAEVNKKITYANVLGKAPDGSAASPSFSFNSDTNSGISGGSDTFVISTGGTAAISVDSSQNVTLSANLTVSGTTTTIDTTTLTVKDKNIEIAKGNGNDAAVDGAGITIDSTDGDKTWNWVDSTDAWTSSEHIHLGDDKKLLLGASSDLSIYHSTNSLLKNITGELFLRSDGAISFQDASGSETFAKFIDNGAVELYYDNSKKFETTSTGTKITGQSVIDGDVQWNGSDGSWGAYWDKSANIISFKDNKKIGFGTSNDLQIYHDGTNNVLIGSTGDLYQKSADDMYFRVAGDESGINIIGDGAVELYYDNSKKFDTVSGGTRVFGYLSMQGSGGHIYLPDSAELKVGSGEDLKIYHDGSNSYIHHDGTGDFTVKSSGSGENVWIQAGAGIYLNPQGSESGIDIVQNNAVKLYYDNSKKFETAPNGTIMGDSVWAYYGTDSDLFIGHNGSNAFLKNTTGDFNIQADALYLKNKDGDETYIKCANDNQVELYHNNVKRLETKSGGVQMHGDVWAWEIYNNTTSGGSNVRVQSSGLLQRDTSSRRYKNSITDAVHGLADLKKLRSVTYKGNNDGDTIFGGLIAEEVHDAGLTEFVDYDSDNQPDALKYGNMVSLCIKAIQELSAEVETLKTKVAALESS